MSVCEVNVSEPGIHVLRKWAHDIGYVFLNAAIFSSLYHLNLLQNLILEITVSLKPLYVYVGSSSILVQFPIKAVMLWPVLNQS